MNCTIFFSNDTINLLPIYLSNRNRTLFTLLDKQILPFHILDVAAKYHKSTKVAKARQEFEKKIAKNENIDFSRK